ncbi:uncharacterized protein LOC110191689 [Drosophila serrata]|uniref:uncharacterized protein LOC110191689 n=1 Tax=Drosophila serrata TaxID=7274 RepID=UPI000A1D1EF6|nr:uncharacterized protein LOC110191689 [Drosophila serrata]
MPLAPGTRCFFVIAVISFLLEASYCLEDLMGNRPTNPYFPLAEDHARIFLVTLLALVFLILMGCLGCLCCYCRTWQAMASAPDGLDIYAPRTQSIVWPTLPQDTVRIRELTLQHTAKSGCLCPNCRPGRISLYIENCGLHWNNHGSTMSVCSQGIAARWCLLLITAALTTFPHLSNADDNITDFDWLNETQLLEMFDYENITEWNSTKVDVDVDVDVDTSFEGTNVGESFGESFVEKSNGSSNVIFSFKELRQNQYYARIVFMIVLLHVAVLGVCITIYSLVYCKVRTLRKLRRAKAQRCLQLMNLQSQHVPNSKDCPCSGCIMARDMVQGLILQQLHEVVEC